MNDQDIIIIKTLKDRFKEISTWRVIPCIKCKGTGHLTWTMVDGGICYDCKGEGIIIDKWANYRRRLKAEEKRKAKQKEATQKGLEKFEQNKERYKNDPRIGKETRRKMNRPQWGDAYAFEVYSLLNQWDSDPEWIKTRDHIRRNLAE